MSVLVPVLRYHSGLLLLPGWHILRQGLLRYPVCVCVSAQLCDDVYAGVQEVGVCLCMCACRSAQLCDLCATFVRPLSCPV